MNQTGRPSAEAPDPTDEITDRMISINRLVFGENVRVIDDTGSAVSPSETAPPTETVPLASQAA